MCIFERFYFNPVFGSVLVPQIYYLGLFMKRFLPCSGKMFLNGIAVIKLTKFGLK